ncbi:MAG: lamin tail domain-containing protein [Methanomassiliicoccales archaeon]
MVKRPGRYRLRGITGSRRAQMPFSVAAVLLLTLSTFSVALVYQLDEGDSDIPLSVLRSMDRTAEDFRSGLEELSHNAALRAVEEAGPLNRTRMVDQFQIIITEEMEKRFPKRSGPFTLHVDSHDLNLTFLSMSLKGTWSSPGSGWNLTTVPAYLTVVGEITLMVEGSEGEMIKRLDLDRDLFLPYPLLANRMMEVKEWTEGGRCQLENMVRYQLSALVQSRVLLGHGLSSGGHGGTEGMVTEEDVGRAVNLSTLLMQRQLLRSVDPHLKQTVADASVPAFGEILDTALEGGRCDPADLFLLSYGHGQYDMSSLVSQTLYAFADAVALRWLEFLHVIDIAKGLEGAWEWGTLVLSDIMESLTGEDRMQERARDMIMERLEESGIGEERYRYMHMVDQDAHLEVPANGYTVVDDLNRTHRLTLGGKTYPVDFPGQDILGSEDWGEFLVRYREETFSLGERLSSALKSLALDLASRSLPPLSLELDPADGMDFLEELSAAGRSMEGDLERAIDATVEGNEKLRLGDGFSHALIDFLERDHREIFHMNDSVEAGAASIAEEIARETAESLQDFGSESQRGLEATLVDQLLGSPPWNLRGALEEEFMGAAGWRMDMIIEALRDYHPSDGRGGLEQALMDLAVGAIGGLPGLGTMLSSSLMHQFREMVECADFRGDRVELTLPSEDHFPLMDGDRVVFRESLRVGSTLNLTSLETDIVRPDQHASEENPNLHRTDIGNYTLLPYATQWNVSVQGRVGMALSVGSPVYGEGLRTEVAFPLEFHSTLSPRSGWDLAGVDYTPTSTLAKEMADFMEGAWSRLADGLRYISQGITGTFDFLKDMVETIVSYSMRAVEVLGNGLQVMVESVRSFLEGLGAEGMGMIADFLETVLGKVEFNITLFGLKFSIQTQPADLALGNTKDLLRITLSFSTMDTTISISNRLIRLGEGDYDLLTNCTLAASGWRVSLVFDPLMKVYSHFVEIKGVLQGMSFLLYLPQVVQYERAVLSLQDIPGLGTFLSSIPTPIPGIKASLDAGFEIRYRRPSVNHVVINEFEQNPPGPDRGNEWIELYNPTDQVVDLSGWSVKTSHGIQALERLDVSIMPGSRLVYTFPSQALDNGGRDKFPLNECVTLLDEEGRRVDSTPWAEDHHNDERSWQRSYDGSDRWVFKEATKGATNGKRTAKYSEMEVVKDLVWDSVARAFGSLDGNASMDSLGLLLQRAVDNLREEAIDRLGSFMVEIGIFLQVSLKDYSTSFGTGFRMALVITGDCVEATLQWLSEAVIDAVSSLGNPRSIRLGEMVEGVMENTFIRFKVFGKVGLPSMLSSGLDIPSCRLGVMAQANLATVGALTGHDWGEWRLGFGLVLSDLPARALPKMFGLDADQTVDVWVLRASLFPSEGPA